MPVPSQSLIHEPIIVKIPISLLGLKTLSKLQISDFRKAIGIQVRIKRTKKTAIHLHTCSIKNIIYVLEGGETEEAQVLLRTYYNLELDVVSNIRHGILPSCLLIPKKITILGKLYSWSHAPEHVKDTVVLGYDTTGRLLINSTIFKSYYYLCLSAGIIFANAKVNFYKDKNRLSAGSCTGMSVIFHAQESGKLKAHCIYSRIPYLALSSDSPNRWFIATRNFTNIPRLCRGFVVAYTFARIITRPQFSRIIEDSNWELGIIACMDENRITIAKTKPMSTDGKYSIDELINIEVGSHITIQYLNVINYHSVCKDGFIVASGINPDIAETKKKDTITLHKCKPSKCLASPRHVTRGNRSMRFKYNKNISSFLDLYADKKRGSIARKGAHVIIVEGPVSKLKWDDAHATDGFLCPRYNEYSQNQKSFPQRYTRISKKVRSSKEYTTFDQDAHKLNPFLDKMGHGNVDLLCLDISKFPNGIMIVYSKNENLSEMRIKEKFDLNQEGKEHWDLVEKGIVLSHWIPHDLAMENSVEDIKITLLHNRSTHGYGNGRRVTNSVGGNRYHGQKLSGRAIPHPEY